MFKKNWIPVIILQLIIVVFLCICNTDTDVAANALVIGMSAVLVLGVSAFSCALNYLKHSDARLQEERERCLLALESTTDIFMEYGRKIIGTMKNINDEKLREFAADESLRRDGATGLLSREYGLSEMRRHLSAEGRNPFFVCWVHVGGFDRLASHYGRVYAGLVLQFLYKELFKLKREGDFFSRFSNDGIVAFLEDTTGDDTGYFADAARRKALQIYTGENPDYKFEVFTGAVSSEEGDNIEALVLMAYNACRFAARRNELLKLWRELPASDRSKYAAYPDMQPSLSIDIAKQGIVSFAFELFERTSDVHSAINVLLSLLSDMFSLHRIVMFYYDADFGSDRVSHQWGGVDGKVSEVVESVSYEDAEIFDSLIDENGMLLYTEVIARTCGERVAEMLCVQPGKKVNALCCVMHDNGVNIGRVIYKAEDSDKVWEDSERQNLYEISKIIASHLCIEKLNSAGRAKSEFLSRVSHEIRTPLAAIIGMTKIAKTEKENLLKVESALGKIEYAAKHLLNLINDVLEMSGIESGKLTIEAGPFSLSDFAEGIDVLMRPSAESADIDFNIEKKFSRTNVIGDEKRLRRILINLVDNAFKFTPAGGRVVLSIAETECDGGVCSFKFSVKDNGIGISPEDRAVIFKAFEQPESASRYVAKRGTGLGLPISSNIVTAMGGKIEMSSVLNEGSEFYFTVKLPAEGGYTAVPEDDTGEFEGLFSGKRALLAEDNETNVEIAKFLLEYAGMEVDVAVNGKEAVELFSENEPGYFDIIITDIQMPVMDGFTAAKNIRRKKGRPDAGSLPIVAITANAPEDVMKRSIEAGINGHLSKPIDPEKLYEALRKFLKK